MVEPGLPSLTSRLCIAAPTSLKVVITSGS
jgi:hypothetical protein